MTEESEWPEVTADNLRALRELRFVTVNQSRTRALGYDADQWRVAATGQRCNRVQRAPGVVDWEMESTRPRIIAAVEEMLGLAAPT